jgi:hypothetical protein
MGRAGVAGGVSESGKYRYVILDHDSRFNEDVMAFLKATGLKVKRTSIQAPWQNGSADRWVGGCRRELVGHIIPLNESHLRRLIVECVIYKPRGPDSRCPAERHSESTADGD